MITAIDVAKYFEHRSEEENKPTPDKLKIQKLVYYAQAWNIVFYDKPLFEEKIEAGKNGPAIRSLYDYNTLTSYTISQTLNKFTDSEIYVLEEVFRVYGDLNSADLRKLTHREIPWQGARIGLDSHENSHEPILVNEMQDYYINFIDMSSEHPKISNIAKDPDKKVFITAKFKDGTKQLVKECEVENFIIKNKDKLVTQQIKPRRRLTSLPV